MTIDNALLKECNAFSYFHWFLMEKWKDLLASGRMLELKKQLPELKRQLLEKLVKLLKEQASIVCQRNRKLLNDIEQAYKYTGYGVVSFEVKLEERGLFGVSQPFGMILFEVGLEFDHYLNAPIVPGSSIKGVVRSAWLALFGDDEKEAENYLFGSTERAGACIFHDGYPIEAGRNGYLLYPDVLTPHYIMGGKDLLEEHKVIKLSPVIYLTVAPETVFKFIVAIPGNIGEKLQEMFRKAMLESLNLGIGSKTTVGYGRFSLRSLHIIGVSK
jgi:CRISPR-associated protein Cmr6